MPLLDFLGAIAEDIQGGDGEKREKRGAAYSRTPHKLRNALEASESESPGSE
jgi:hypothetical protein